MSSADSEQYDLLDRLAGNFPPIGSAWPWPTLERGALLKLTGSLIATGLRVLIRRQPSGISRSAHSFRARPSHSSSTPSFRVIPFMLRSRDELLDRLADGHVGTLEIDRHGVTSV
jgi:hypothetical protein